MQFQFDAQSLLGRLIMAVVAAALVFGLIFFFLPVMIVVLLIVAALGLGLYLYAWFTGKGVMDIVVERNRQFREARETPEEDATYTYTSTTRETRVETTDKKRWKMDDVEDVESR